MCIERSPAWQPIAYDRFRRRSRLRSRSGLIPVLWIKIGYQTRSFGMAMRFVTTPDATVLTGLSTATLREWTSRRALIPADVPPKGKGSPAGFTWQTILLLRIAVTLRDRFHLELQPHRALFASLKTGLRRTSFIALWGKALALQGDDDWGFVEEAEAPPLNEDALIIRLQPHLEALSVGFALPRPTSSFGQLELFPARSIEQSVNAPVASVARKRRADPIATMRRRSA